MTQRPFPNCSASALLLILASSGAYADDGTGAYIGLGLGLGAQHFDSIGRHETDDPDAGSFGAKLKLGYFFTPVWGVEAGYVRLGNFRHHYTGGTFENRPDSLYLAGVARTQLSDHWSAYAKAMLSSNRSRASASNPQLAEFAQLSGRRGNFVLGGIGLEYRVDERFSIGLEADGLGKLAERNNGGLVSVDLNYRF